MTIVTRLYPKGFDFIDPPYAEVFAERFKLYDNLADDPEALHSAHNYYSTHPVDWIEDFAITVDPRQAVSRESASRMPFVLFPRQKELIEWFYWLLQRSDDPELESDGLCEKTRECGLSWLCVVFAVWVWTYMPNAKVGFGSLNAESVDTKGNPNSLLEKVRIVLRNLPPFMLPSGYNEDKDALIKRVVNRVTGAVISGQGGVKIGRGDRCLIYFKDESAHYDHAEVIDASLSFTSNCKIDISSVNGTGNLFHDKRQSFHDDNVFVFRWEDDCRKTQAWHDREHKKYTDAGIEHIFMQEVERDYGASVSGIFIPAKWVQAAVNYPLEAIGVKRAALDVADETYNGDLNALTHRHGNVVSGDISEWAGEDTGYSANELYLKCVEIGADQAVFDRIGVGAGVHTDMKKLAKEGKLNFKVHGFVANSVVYNEWEEYAEGVMNRDLFDDAKAQATWNVRRRCEKCYKNKFEGAEYPDEELISLPNHPKLLMEMSRPKREPGTKAHIKVESKKHLTARGLKSPNLLDSLVMLYAEVDFSGELRMIMA